MDERRKETPTQPVKFAAGAAADKVGSDHQKAFTEYLCCILI
jgi:hypothetical protein